MFENAYLRASVATLILALMSACSANEDVYTTQVPADSVTRGAAIVGRVEPAQSGIGVIAVQNGMQTGITLTEADGSYRLVDMRPGQYGLDVSGLGFFTDTSVRSLVVAEGEETEALLVTLRPLEAAVTFVGEVVGARDSTPIEGVQVAIRCRSGICANLSTVTDAEGKYTIGVWPGLAADVIFTKDGYHIGHMDVDGQPPATILALGSVALDRAQP